MGLMMLPGVTAILDTGPREEDQVLAALVQQDAAQRYEFKILRGTLGAFYGAERLQRVLAEEARAQWELAMKLDDQRLALRRPREARSRDALRTSDIDPYRTTIAIGRTRSLALLAMVLGLAIALVLGLVVAGSSPEQLSRLGLRLDGQESQAVVATIVVILIVVVAVMIAIARVAAARRR